MKRLRGKRQRWENSLHTSETSREEEKGTGGDKIPAEEGGGNYEQLSTITKRGCRYIL